MLESVYNFLKGTKYLIFGPERDYARNELKEFCRNYWHSQEGEKTK